MILILSIITTVLTVFSVLFAAIQLKKINESKINTSKNAKRLYIQNIAINKKYVKTKLTFIKDSLTRQGYTDKESLNNIWILPYYIITLNNSTFEKAIKNIIEDTEEIIKINIDNNHKDINDLLKLHELLKETLMIIENGNYLINLFFNNYDKDLEEDIKYISSKDDFQKSVPNNTLYTPGGNPNTLIYATPIMYYNRQISNIKNHLKYSEQNDIEYISINDFDTNNKTGGLIHSLQINKIFKNLQESIDIIENIIE